MKNIHLLANAIQSYIYDYTLEIIPGNGSWASNIFNNRSKFKPAISAGDIYLENDKVLRSNPDGSFSGDDNSVGE